MAGLLRELGDDEPAHPLEALLSRHDEADRMTRALGLLVGGLALPGSDGGDESLYGPDHLGDAAPHVLVRMLGDWSDRHARIAKVLLDHGVDAARLRLQSAQVDALFGAFVAAVEDVGLDQAQQNALRNALADRLEGLDA